MNNQNSVNLSVKDFQIIQNANLSFLPGLNCIIGQSNNGKSALMRAAKACIYNTPGTTSVRLGCNNFAVGLQMNGHTVILQKGNSSLYKVDNNIYGKIGRTQLEEVSNALGIKQLNINGVNEEINFWDQMEKPFLLDRSETDLFRFIVDSGKDNNVTTALKTITQDRQQISRDIIITEGKIQAIEDTLKKQEEDLKNSEYQLNVCNKVIEIGPKIKRVNEITSIKNSYINNKSDLESSLLKKENLDTILDTTYFKLKSINSNIDKYNLIKELIIKINKKEEDIKQYKNLLNNIDLIDASRLTQSLNKYKLLSSLITKTKDISGELQELSNKQFPILSDEFNKNIEKFKELSLLITNISEKKELLTDLDTKVKSIKKDIKQVEKEIKEIGVCPTCGQLLHNNK